VLKKTNKQTNKIKQKLMGIYFYIFLRGANIVAKCVLQKN